MSCALGKVGRGVGGTAIAHSKELLSLAYVQTLCAASGFNYNEPQLDNDGVDITIRGKNFPGKYSSPKIELQLKCTDIHSYIDMKTDELVYPLKVENYNILVSPSPLPTFLAVHFAPEESSSWVQHSRFGVTLRYGTFWMSLRGLSSSSNSASVSVRIPLSQRLDAASLLWMMEGASKGLEFFNGMKP
ncbi:DUF4365 domain-containing protein [Pseudomonas eucalypticola]|uniref:DUF4365 domain-containing protein n=1 Tax=Pseudomonas eucalypticola TaxID=2599595 RepID=A0A7D5HIW7_9PSED|nr:DUF4365 domain-containing protein [Pseudomonas eucalypticola]